MFALSEPDSLSLENNEGAVSEFEDRFRRAVGREGMVRRMIGGGNGVDVRVRKEGVAAPRRLRNSSEVLDSESSSSAPMRVPGERGVKVRVRSQAAPGTRVGVAP